MDPEAERFDAKVTVLIENVRHHVEEEESEYFPEVRSALGRKALGELGDAMATAKETAPTRPHPARARHAARQRRGRSGVRAWSTRSAASSADWRRVGSTPCRT